MSKGTLLAAQQQLAAIVFGESSLPLELPPACCRPPSMHRGVEELAHGQVIHPAILNLLRASREVGIILGGRPGSWVGEVK